MDFPKTESANIPPIQLGPDSRFNFRCHKGLSCFTTCCRGINIMLTPYDIVRLKNRMQISSGDFLALYTTPQLLEKTDLPVVTLKMFDDKENSCPFVRDDGCIVYQDRPTACRYYPLGVGSLSFKEQEEGGFYFFIQEPHCRGFEEDTQWSVESWRMDQGVDIHDQINAEWTDLIVRKRSLPPNIRLTDKTKNMFFTASYDIDRFRRFVFESSFLSLYHIEKETVERIRSDEIALLQFGFKWLKWLLFQDGELKMNEAAAAVRLKKFTEKQTK
jgi:hypothetical protein